MLLWVKAMRSQSSGISYGVRRHCMHVESVAARRQAAITKSVLAPRPKGNILRLQTYLYVR